MEAKQVVGGERLVCLGCGGYIHADHPDIEYMDKKKTLPMCLECGLPLVPLCPEAHACTCAVLVQPGIAHCSTCGKPVCPGCGSHDVSQVSRVTGYLSDVAGWNKAKRQELLDRQRVDFR
jgi:hypothetical protein